MSRRFEWLVLLALALPAGLSVSQESELERSVGQLTRVLAILEQKFVDPVDAEAALFNGAMPAMVRNLDPFSAFLDPDQFESLREMQRSTEKGFGSVLAVNHGRVDILQTLPESPMARAGVSPGDEIVGINGYWLAELNQDQLVAVLSEARQRQVDMLVRRPQFSRLIPLTLTPAELADPSVQLSFFPRPDIGYVRIVNFEAGTDVELREAVERLGGDSLEGLVIDLRKNPGGLVEAAVRTLTMFLEPDQRILWIEGRDGPKEEVRTPPGEPYRFPLAVLIDSETASAAELVAAALQDHGRAALVGTHSFGKGLVQSVFELSGGAGLALTTARYLSPDSRTIQRPIGKCGDFQLSPCGDEDEPTARGGIEPDVVAIRNYTPFETVMKASESFLDFAKQYVQGDRVIDENFEPSPQMLDEFQLFLSQRRIRVTLAEWTSAMDFIRANLKQEVFNLTLGVESGYKVEMRSDPTVLAAIEALTSATSAARLAPGSEADPIDLRP